MIPSGARSGLRMRTDSRPLAKKDCRLAANSLNTRPYAPSRGGSTALPPRTSLVKWRAPSAASQEQFLNNETLMRLVG